MNEFECLENEKFIILKNRELMIDLLHETCLKGLNCLCFLESLSKEDLVQKLLLKQAEIDINQNLTKEDYKLLVQAIHDICNWGLYVEKFQTLTKTNNKIKKLKPDCVFIESEQDITAQKHIKSMAEKRQVPIVLTFYNDETFNTDGSHKLGNKNKKPQVKIIIDFIDKNLKIDIVPTKDKKSKQNNNSDIQVIKTPKNYRLVNSNFEITKDFKTILVDNHAYSIPDYYNIDMIKNEDEKTWQMIFYQIFADKINTELVKRSDTCI